MTTTPDAQHDIVVLAAALIGAGYYTDARQSGEQVGKDALAMADAIAKAIADAPEPVTEPPPPAP